MIARNTSQLSRFKRIVIRTGTARPGAVVHRTRPAQVPVNPLITPASNIIVVKKPHTNPARVAITLRTSSRFRRSGTLQRTTVPTSGGIHIFRTQTAANEMQFNGRDNVFSASDLTRGVQVFATADRPSGNPNDFQLTLTLAPGPNTGPPATVSLTAVELTLDVGLSRPSPGVAPPIMSANDKINIGRFVQVRNPGFDHERAMIVLRPPNPQVPLTVRLEALTAELQAFGFEAPAGGQGAHPRPARFTSDLLTPSEFQLFVEATAASTGVRDTGFRYGVEGVENEADRVAMTAVQFDVTNTASNTVAAATFVRFGLWDHAFDPATGNLLNGAADANHFIGADSRRFFFRLHDLNAGANPQMQWRTIKADGTNDHAPPNQPLQLTEAPAGSHQFFSQPVFLVTDDDDAQLTGSNLPAAQVASLTPRIRKVTVDDTHQLDGRLSATYSPAAGQTIRSTAVLFSRTPEERRRMNVHLVSVRDGVGGAGLLSNDRKTRTTNLMRSIYAVCGVFANVIQTEIVIDPPASTMAFAARYPPNNAAFLAGPIVEGFSFVGNNLDPSASQLDIVNAVRALAGFQANDIYIVFVKRILTSPLPPVPPPASPPVAFDQVGGQSFVDSFSAASANGARALGFTFVSTIVGSNNVEVHEVTHSTTNLRNAAGGHFDLGLPSTAPVPPNAPGPIDGKNLMHRFGPTFPGGVLNPKRLWNTQFTNNNYAPPLVNPPQIDAIRASRFVLNF